MLNANLVWGNLTNPAYQGDATQGNVVKVPAWTQAITITDYAVGTALATAETPDGSTVDLALNKQKYFHVLVDDIYRVQSSPDLMAQAISVAAAAMAKTIDTDIYTEFNLDFVTARSVRVAEAVDASTFDTKLLAAVRKVARELSKLNIPMEDRWLVVHPDFTYALNNYLTTASATGNIFAPTTVEGSFNNGFVGRLFGFDLYETTQIPSITASSVKYHRAIAGQGRQNVAHVSQIQNMEALRSPTAFADIVRALNVYGTKLINTARSWTIEHQQS